MKISENRRIRRISIEKRSNSVWRNLERSNLGNFYSKLSVKLRSMVFSEHVIFIRRTNIELQITMYGYLQ